MYFLCRDKNPRSSIYLLSFLFIVILLIVILDESGVTGELPAHEGQPTVSQTTVSPDINFDFDTERIEWSDTFLQLIK